MNDLIKPSTKIHTIDDAIRLSKKRLPKLVFDFIDGASGDDKLAEINSTALDQIRLEPKVFRNVENRNLSKKIFDFHFDYPFGFAPMGMTNLSWPEADKMIAKEIIFKNMYSEILVNEDNILKFRLKNTRKLDRKSLNLLRNQEIQAIIN